jgi:hypothetical protein
MVIYGSVVFSFEGTTVARPPNDTTIELKVCATVYGREFKSQMNISRFFTTFCQFSCYEHILCHKYLRLRSVALKKMKIY